MKSISLRNRGSLASSRLQAKRVRIPVHIVEASQGECYSMGNMCSIGLWVVFFVHFPISDETSTMASSFKTSRGTPPFPRSLYTFVDHLASTHRNTFPDTRARSTEPFKVSFQSDTNSHDNKKQIYPHPFPGSPNNGQSTNSPTEAFNLLEGFFLGRAFAQTLNERLGSVAADIFSEFAKADAERREQMRAFQEEVRARARQEMQASAAPGSVLPGSGGGQAATANGNGAGMTGGAPVSLPRGMNEMRKPMEPKVPDLGEVRCDAFQSSFGCFLGCSVCLGFFGGTRL